MNPLTFPAIAAERQNHPACGWFFDFLEEFLQNLHAWQINIGENEPANGIPIRDGAPCGICKLTFYFYFRPAGQYQNGIWIKVENINNIDVWLRVGLNINGNKNVNIWSLCTLDCPGINMEFHPALALPPVFNAPGIFKTGEVVHAATFEDILQQICNLMPCVCNSSCL